MSALSSSPFMIQRLEKQGDVAQYLTKACPQVASVKDSLNGIGPPTSLRNIDVSHRDKRCTTSNTQTHVCSIFLQDLSAVEVASDNGNRRRGYFQVPSPQLSALTPSLALSQSQSMFTSPALANTFPRAISLPD